MSGEMTLPPKLSDAATGEDCTFRFAEETGCGPHHVLTFPELPRVSISRSARSASLSAFQECGPRSVGSGCRVWSPCGTGWTVHRQSLLTSIESPVYCQGGRRLCDHCWAVGPCVCDSHCQFVCPQCMVKENAQLASLVHPETHMLLVFGEIDWCPNLVRPAQP